MEKRITAISLNNYKAYFGKYEPILLPNGENILIYGENGSGKSSLYKALNNFFLSSRNTSIKFIKNKYNEGEIGEINVEFSDYDNNNGEIIEGSDETYLFSDTTFNHNIPLVQNIALVKGFFDYTDLLRIYFHDDPQPNLFNLIVLTILGEHIPISSGGNFKFKAKWQELQRDLIKCHTRKDRTHKGASAFLLRFETQLRASLDDVFSILNYYLESYFIDFNIELEYILKPIKFNYTKKKINWNTTTDLRLIVKKNGEIFTDGYSNYLNEARLSAIAVCMYLASLKVTNKNVDLKILYFDDVFIGLDSGNRVPILNILRDEFADYQKFISTYDRHWYELAKRQFQIHKENSWKYIEMYVGHDITSNGNKINKPIVNIGLSYAEKGTMYLHHCSNPDYPAAANYFRKALEELISLNMPQCELADGDYVQIPEYKLSKLLKRCSRTFEKVNNSTYYINIIQGHLYSLLHPLSHHEITSLIYKRELESIETAFYKLKEQLELINLKENYRCLQGKGDRLRINFHIDPVNNHYQNYYLALKESILFFQDANGVLRITKSDCYICYMEGNNDLGFQDGQTKYSKSIPKDTNRFNYQSLINAVEKIYEYIVTIQKYSFVRPANPLDVIEYYDGTNWQPLNDLIVWR